MPAPANEPAAPVLAANTEPPTAARSVKLPTGSLLENRPLTLVQVSPPLSLRYRPPRAPFCKVETRMTLPARGTIAVICSPARADPPLSCQVAPPSVDFIRLPPAPAMRDELTLPVPAYSTTRLPSTSVLLTAA